MLSSDHAPRGSTEIFDAPAIVKDLETLSSAASGGERELRDALAKRLKTALNEGHRAADSEY